MVPLTESEIVDLVKRLKKRLAVKDLRRIWPGFEPFPYALYNEKKVYMTSHPNPPDHFKEIEPGIFQGDWTNQFFGNTAIDFNGHVIAIWNIATAKKNMIFGKFLSAMIHEMFHGYQMCVNDQRYAMELLHITYPFTVKNISLRIKEREWLVKAVYEKEIELKQLYLKQFVAHREARRDQIQDYLSYELGMESREGTAVYVEYRSALEEILLPENYVLAQYSQELAGSPLDLDKFRMSCYAPGLYLCVLLDQLVPNWKEKYMQSTKFLYDFLIEMVQPTSIEIEAIDDPYAQRLVTEFKKIKTEAFEKFDQKDGYKIVFRGQFKVAGFDPMNMVSLDYTLLHKHFFKFISADREITIKGETMSKHQSNIVDLLEVLTYVEHKPVLTENSISIDDIGTFAGKVDREGDIYYVKLD